MSTATVIKDEVNPSLIPRDPASSRSYVRGRCLTEHRPSGPGDYGSTNGNYHATFVVPAGSDEQLDLPKLYFRGKVQASVASGTPVLGDRSDVYLDRPGASSLIKSISVRSGATQAEFASLQHYNKVMAMLAKLKTSKTDTDHMRSLSELDDSAYHFGWADDSVSDILSAPPTAISSTAVKFKQSNRWLGYVDNGASSFPSKQFTHHPGLPFFQQQTLFPANMTGGLIIDVEFERPKIALYAQEYTEGTGVPLAPASHTTTFNYLISNLVLVVERVQMRDIYLEKMRKMYSSPQGINLTYLQYHTNQLDTSGTSISHEVNLGVNSIRYMIAGLYPQYSFVESSDIKTESGFYPANSLTVRKKMVDYWYTSGGDKYPLSYRLQAEGPIAAEVYTQTKLAMQNETGDGTVAPYAKGVAGSFDHTLWVNDLTWNYSGAPYTESRSFLFGANMTNMDDYTGLNTLSSKVRLEATFGESLGAAADGPIVSKAMVLAAYDVNLNISQAGMVVV